MKVIVNGCITELHYHLEFRISKDVLGWEIKQIQHLNTREDKEDFEDIKNIDYVASKNSG